MYHKGLPHSQFCQLHFIGLLKCVYMCSFLMAFFCVAAIFTDVGDDRRLSRIGRVAHNATIILILTFLTFLVTFLMISGLVPISGGPTQHLLHLGREWSDAPVLFNGISCLAAQSKCRP